MHGRQDDDPEAPATPDGPATSLTVVPIGVARTPFPDRASAPRQPPLSEGARGTIELLPDPRLEHALSDLETFQRIWVLFWFHLNAGWKPKVRPPRSEARRGVFATRSPYRPNPIGMSVLRLERIEGLTLHVLDVDLVDGTPILDIKPYVPYSDAFPDSGHGWLDGPGATDPGPRFDVELSALAIRQLARIRELSGEDLEVRIRGLLATGPTPHPYRRIRPTEDGFVMAVRSYRARFRISGKVVTVERIHTGYRARELGPGGAAPDEHRRYVEEFGLDGSGGESRPGAR